MSRKPAGYIEAPTHTSLDDFAKGMKPTHRQIEQWFSERPSVLEEVKRGLTVYSDHTVWKWLSEEHEFPFSVSTLRGLKPTRPVR